MNNNLLQTNENEIDEDVDISAIYGGIDIPGFSEEQSKKLESNLKWVKVYKV